MIVSFSFVDSPQVSLRLGRTLDADNIRTGHDVYFECDVKANPSPLRLEWLHNVNTWWRCTISKEAWLVEHRPDRLKIAFFPSDSVMLFLLYYVPLRENTCTYSLHRAYFTNRKQFGGHVQKWWYPTVLYTSPFCSSLTRGIPTCICALGLLFASSFLPYTVLKRIQSFQGHLLEQDTSKGIIMSTQSLVLQHIEVDAVGTYTCRAVNSEGSGESNPVPLKIMCKFHR